MREDRLTLLVGAYSLAMILGALFFEHVMNVLPCEMCHWQRWPHDAAILFAFGGLALYYTKIIDLASLKLLLWLALIAVLTTGLIGGDQALVEWKLLPGPASCTGDRFVLGVDTNLTNHVIRCDIAAWRLFGLSLAGYNFLISSAVAVLGALVLLKKFNPVPLIAKLPVIGNKLALWLAE